MRLHLIIFKAQSRTNAPHLWLGGKEGLENFFLDGIRDAVAIIFYGNIQGEFYNLKR